MTEEKFWSIVDSLSQESDIGFDFDRQVSSLKLLLESFTVEELVEFYEFFKILIKRANSWKLWAAATLVPDFDNLQGCGDDDFESFRASLVMRGKETFYRVLSRPDALADLRATEFLKKGEILLYAPNQEYRKRFGLERSLAEVAKLPQLSEPDGEVFDEKDFDYFQRELPRCLGKWGIRH